MFAIKPENPDDWQHAMFILSTYFVKIESYSNEEDADTTYIIVRGDQDQVRLAEMAFQMNWHQVGARCPHCSPDLDTCGHLTFNKPINPAF